MGKLSAISAACGPYCMSCGIRDRKTATNMRIELSVFSSPKYANPQTPMIAAPVMYSRLRPTRSDRCPKNGIENSDNAAAAMTVLVMKLSLMPRSPVPYSSTKTVKM